MSVSKVTRGCFVMSGMLALSCFAAEAQSLKIDDFASPGVTIFHGSNKVAWLKKSCKLTLLGTARATMTMVTLSDSDASYTYWMHSASLLVPPGGAAFKATVVDAMNEVSEPGSAVKVYANRGGVDAGIAELTLAMNPRSRQVESASLHYVDAAGKVSEVDCRSLVRRDKK